MRRRQFIGWTGGIVAGGAMLGGTGSGGVAAAPGDNPVQDVQQDGTWNVIIPGSSSGLALKHHYRSATRPLSMESDVGGLVSTRPRRGGIELSIDLTEDDVYGSPGFTAWRGPLSAVGSIEFEADGELIVGLPLGIAFNGGTIADWEPVGGYRERWVGFDGDDRALSAPLSSDTGPVTRDDEIFTIPSNGGACDEGRPPGDPCSGSGYSIQELEDEFDDPIVRVAGSIGGGPGDDEAVTVSRFEVIER